MTHLKTMKRTPELLQSPMFFGGSFPCLPSDPAIVNQKFWSNATWADGVREVPAASMTPRAVFRRDLLWTDARDVWHCAVASVWAEFSLPPPHHRPVPLLDAIPLVLWVWARPAEKQQPPCGEKMERATKRLLSEFYGEPVKGNVGLHLLAVRSQLVSVQLDHHQLLFLLRLLESCCPPAW